MWSNWQPLVSSLIGRADTNSFFFQFECCGVVNASDWIIPLGTQETSGLPVSCCNHVYGTVQIFNCTVETAYRIGCSEAFGSWVKSHAASIGAAGVFLVLMQVT